MPNAMPYSTPTQDTREEGAMKSLNAVAGSLLARLPKNGRAVSLATVTANMWGARTSQGRCDTVVLGPSVGGTLRRDGRGVQGQGEP